MPIENFWGALARALPLFAAALVVAGCGARPDPGTIERAITEQLLDGGMGRIYAVENFRKTNGLPRDENTYVAEVSYDLRFKTDIQGAAGILQADSGSIFAAGTQAARLALKYGDFEEGEVVHREEQVRFVRTEQGWRIDRTTR